MLLEQLLIIIFILGYKETAHHLTMTSPSHLFSAENVAELSRNY